MSTLTVTAGTEDITLITPFAERYALTNVLLAKAIDSGSVYDFRRAHTQAVMAHAAAGLSATAEMAKVRRGLAHKLARTVTDTAAIFGHTAV